jgi:hypothetical protein
MSPSREVSGVELIDYLTSCLDNLHCPGRVTMAAKGNLVIPKRQFQLFTRNSGDGGILDLRTDVLFDLIRMPGPD